MEGPKEVSYTASYFIETGGHKKFASESFRRTNSKDALVAAIKYADVIVKMPSEGGRNTVVIERLTAPDADVDLRKIAATLDGEVGGINYVFDSRGLAIQASLAEQHGLARTLTKQGKPAESSSNYSLVN